MPACCICYITDAGYLFPSFVSAVQARAHTPADIADVIILSVGVPARQEQAFAWACAAEGLRYLPVPPGRLEGASAMLGRLFLHRILPDDYGQLLYIDSDTQIDGPLTPLLLASVPAGQFRAATDPMAFALRCAGRNDRKAADYFATLGMTAARQEQYFNSGVLRINRDGWDETGREAWALFQKLRGHSRYPDQDALNLVAEDRRIPMSLIWNFPVFLRNARLGHAITPHIIHYMSNPKPWHGQFPPWRPAEYETYLTTARRYPALAPFLPHMPRRRKLKYLLQQEYKRIQQTMAWGHGARHREILSDETIRNPL